MPAGKRELAWKIFQQAYQSQMNGELDRARQCFQDALRIEPRYMLARQAVENLRRMVN